MKPAWLAEFHRQWIAARGRDTAARTRAFHRPWDDLLEAAGVANADAKAIAGREAEALAAAGHLEIRRHRRRRYVIEKIALPLEQEHWLRTLFHSDDPSLLRQRALQAVESAREQGHPLYPDLWAQWCGSLADTFAAGRSQRPLLWRQPDNVRILLALVHELTARDWPPHTLVRDADVALGHFTKTIEFQRRAVEAALTQLFQRETTLEALNIHSANSRLHFDGPLTLEFGDGTRHEAGRLRHGDFVTAADLARALRVTTSASRILSVENSKTTFRNLAALNDTRDTLIIATSFPTRAVQIALTKLPPSLPHWHFGDTDPAGYFILSKLREVGSRPVAAWQMEWRDKPDSPPLTGYDRQMLNRLLTAPHMEDVRTDLNRMLVGGRKGWFEQETRPALLVP